MHTSPQASTPVATRVIETRWRRIRGSIPDPESLRIIERLRAVEPRSMSGVPQVVWHQAEGFLVRDPAGNQWIDFSSGIVMANAGHAHPRIVQAIRKAADDRLLSTYAFPQTARMQLLEKLVSLSPIPDSKAILFSAGTEATECAMMLMRRHGQRIRPDKAVIVSFAEGYQGRTLGAALASGRPLDSDWIARDRVRHAQIPFPFPPRWPWGDASSDPTGSRAFEQCIANLEEQGILPEQIAGFIGEAVPGWTTWPMPVGFATALVAWARRHNILVCFDEVQSGCGRTGRWFGFEHCGVVPDLITLGKGLSSSLPVSAVIGPREILDLPEPGEMSSTQGGNPVCAAAALANLNVLEDEQLLAKAESTGARILARLRALRSDYPERVLSVHGPGLFLSIHLHKPDTGEPDKELVIAVTNNAVQRGVMMFQSGRGHLKITPPLCIEPDAALEGADVLCECIAEAFEADH